jgi:hypothetical protein
MSASRRRQRGRSVLLWGLGAFVALQLTASVLLDYVWPQLRFPPFFAQAERAGAFPVAPSIVCLGSSRCGCLLDEDEISDVVRRLTGDVQAQFFNAAVPAGDLYVNEKLLYELLQRGMRPRYVLIELCPESVHQQNAWLTLHVGRQLRWDELPAYLLEVQRTGNALRLAGTRFLPLFALREQIRDHVASAAQGWYGTFVGAEGAKAPRPVAVLPTGPMPDWTKLSADALRDTKAEPSADTKINLQAVAQELKAYRPGGNSALALERMVRRCREHGIEPILFGVPLSSAHRGYYTEAVERPYQEFLRAFAQRHGCRYVEYRDALPDQFFLDHHHASKAGRLLFSRRLGVEMLGPLWGGRDVPAAVVSRTREQ